MGISILDGILSLFVQVLKVSILSGAGILLIVAVSPLLGKRHTVFWRYLLWAVLAIRLVLPFDISIPGQAVSVSIPVGMKWEERNGAAIHSEQIESVSDKSFDNEKEEGNLPERKKELAAEKMLPAEKQSAKESVLAKEEAAVGAADSGTEAFGAESPMEEEFQAEEHQEGESQVSETNGAKVPHLILQLAAVLWAAGVIALFVWQVVCYRRFCRNLEKTKSYLTKKEGLFVYTSPIIGAPMLMGIRKPQILLPCREYHKEQLEFILEHESVHYKRKDLWIKLLITAAGTIHWFNPLVGLMGRQAAKDMELLCDSDVVKNFTKEEKKRYSKTLLACAASSSSPRILCTSEFSKDGNLLKERFDNIFSRGRKRGIVAAAFGIGILLAVSLFVSFGTSKDGFSGNPVREGRGAMEAEKTKEQIQIEALALKEKLSKLSDSVVEDMTGVPFRSSNLRTGEQGSFVGKEYFYEDEEGWRYYLEEDKNKESPLWEIAEAIGPLLLTRYKGEEREILESLIYEDTWKESPVLFSEGRIIYKAAPTADIIGIKDPVLISIAMDGSDRKMADTILYHVSDGLCEDNGWIYYTGWTNDNEFPKPLCRIAPDFTGGPQFVEDIPGLLCGVMDGHVFYMAAKGKKAGIWKRDLVTGKELIHDKWGVSAEEFCYFHAREKEYQAGELREEEIPGCQISFGYDYDGEIYVSDVPFYIGSSG